MKPLWSVFDLPDKEATIGRMERAASEPGYWDDPRRAQEEMRSLGRLKETVNLWRDLASQASTLLELTELELEEGDDSLLEQIGSDALQLSKTLAREEIALTLGGP